MFNLNTSVTTLKNLLNFVAITPNLIQKNLNTKLKKITPKTEQYFFDHFNQPYGETDSFQPIARVMIECLIIHHLKKE